MPEQVPTKIQKMLADASVAAAASNAAREWLEEHGFSDVLKKMEGFLVRKDRTAIDDFYAAGKLAQSVYVEHSDKETQEAFQKMGQVEGLKYRVIRAAYLFSRYFNDDHIAEMKTIKFGNGQTATQTHLMMLTVDYINTPEERIEVLRQAAKANVPANKMNQFIQDYYGRSTSFTTGRKDSVPETIDGLLEQMSKPASDIIRKADTVWFEASALLTEQLDKVTFETRQQLLDAITVYEELGKRAEAILALLRAQDSPYLDAALRNNRAAETTTPDIRQEVRVSG